MTTDGRMLDFVDIDDCADTPCAHDGECVDGVNSFTCNCASGYQGGTCQTGEGQ